MSEHICPNCGMRLPADHCRFHIAAPALLAALKRLLEEEPRDSDGDCFYCERFRDVPHYKTCPVLQAREAIREADLGVQKSTPDETPS